MKKIMAVFLGLFVLFSLHAQNETQQNNDETEMGLSISGGVKAGLLIRNRDFGGKLGEIAGVDDKYPMTLHFASYENSARNGESWLNLGYTWKEDIGNFGVQMGMWAHGDIHSFNDSVRLGDHFVWVSFYEDKMKFIGGQGGGTPISSGGWINADWLSYTGLRFFWIDNSGLSFGIILPDPGEKGIKPVNYLTLLGAGVSFKQDNWWISGQLKNAPIYDDSESNYYGGLHRPDEQDPIAMAGNIALGMGVENIIKGKGFVTLEAMINNLGEDETDGIGNYTISPVSSTFAIKTGYPINDEIYAEIKAKYTIRQGDDAEFTRAVYWGKLEYEPYISFKPFSHLTFHFTLYGAYYINSYFLALDTTPTTYKFAKGQAPQYSPLFDYLSPYQLAIKPSISLSLSGVNLDIGYTGEFSRDHVDNTIYIDFKWSF